MTRSKFLLSCLLAASVWLYVDTRPVYMEGKVTRYELDLGQGRIKAVHYTYHVTYYYGDKNSENTVFTVVDPDEGSGCLMVVHHRVSFFQFCRQGKGY